MTTLLPTLLIVIATVLPAFSTAAPAGVSTRADSAHGIAPPPHRAPIGQLRICGHPRMAAWLSRQSDEFNRRNPSIRVVPRLNGSDVGMAALYTGQADIVLMGREATDSEVQAFEWVNRYRPTAIPILTGSLDRAGQAPALVAFVHRDNPLQALDLAQLDGIFGSARREGWFDKQPVPSQARGVDRDIRFWGQLGLGSDWAKQTIRRYLPLAESGTGMFFRARVLGASNRVHWDGTREFADPVGGSEDGATRMLAALAEDRHGIAIAHLGAAHPGVKALQLVGEDGTPVAATHDSLVDGRYPLVRTVFAYINVPPGEGIDPQVIAWLHDVLEHGRPTHSEGYLPLSDDRRVQVLDQLATLEPAAGHGNPQR